LHFGPLHNQSFLEQFCGSTSFCSASYDAVSNREQPQDKNQIPLDRKNLKGPTRVRFTLRQARELQMLQSIAERYPSIITHLELVVKITDAQNDDEANQVLNLDQILNAIAPIAQLKLLKLVLYHSVDCILSRPSTVGFIRIPRRGERAERQMGTNLEQLHLYLGGSRCLLNISHGLRSREHSMFDRLYSSSHIVTYLRTFCGPSVSMYVNRTLIWLDILPVLNWIALLILLVGSIAHPIVLFILLLSFD